jgi:predicted transcriptional regulator/biotin operon repressor
MKQKNNSKKILIEYLQSHAGKDIPRDEIISQLGISKSRLSELINELCDDGYEIVTPPRSGIVRLESSPEAAPDITREDVRQWLIILALSRLGHATYIELVRSILSITDSAYLENEIDTGDNYTPTDIMNYLEEHSPSTADDIRQFLPLATLRKDLKKLTASGFVEKSESNDKGRKSTVYSISGKSPTILFENSNEISRFMDFYDNFRDSLSNKEPLESLHEKAAVICGWESFDRAARIYGKSNRMTNDQLEHLKKFIEYPYTTKTLHINYSSGDTELDVDSGLLFYSVETNHFYLLCRNTATEIIKPLRLDRIKSVQEGETENKCYGSSEFLNIYEEMFSAAFEEKKHVKVLFDDFGNIKERLELLHKKRKHSQLYEIKPRPDVPYSIVYEDDIRGMSDFSRYLRSFGSSAIVVEPAELRDQMIASNQKILNNYGVTIDENK